MRTRRASGGTLVSYSGVRRTSSSSSFSLPARQSVQASSFKTVLNFMRMSPGVTLFCPLMIPRNPRFRPWPAPGVHGYHPKPRPRAKFVT